MKKLCLTFGLFLLTGNLRAGILDIDYIKPSPTKAFARSLIIPGGGYFYLSEVSPLKNYEYIGMLYLGVTIGAYLLTVDAIKKKNSFKASSGIMAIFLIRLFEFGNTIDDAEMERFKVKKEIVKTRELPGF